MSEVRHLYVCFYTGRVKLAVAMCMTPLKPEQVYTILRKYHWALSEIDRFAAKNHYFRRLT